MVQAATKDRPETQHDSVSPVEKPGLLSDLQARARTHAAVTTFKVNAALCDSANYVTHMAEETGAYLAESASSLADMGIQRSETGQELREEPEETNESLDDPALWKNPSGKEIPSDTDQMDATNVETEISTSKPDTKESVPIFDTSRIITMFLMLVIALSQVNWSAVIIHLENIFPRMVPPLHMGFIETTSVDEVPATTDSFLNIQDVSQAVAEAAMMP